MTRINPFRPHSPINPGMFVGRTPELKAIHEGLVQSRAGLANHFLITGERGIGKTSMLFHLEAMATNLLGLEEEGFNFLVVQTDIDRSTSPFGLVKKVQAEIGRVLGDTEPVRKFLGEAWKFVKSIEAAGIKITDGNPPPDVDLMLEDFAYSLAKTTNRLCGEGIEGAAEGNHDGIVILIDEADNATPELQLGSFVKLLLERLQRHGCNKVMVAMAGLPNLRDVLRDSHPSSLRLFDELDLDRLSRHDVESVINLSLAAANQNNEKATTIENDARQLLVTFSEGYPHFIQQFGYSAFAADVDGNIDHGDVLNGATGKRGALEAIGNRYYRNDFYNKIKKESYRQVLRIMAEKLDGWITKQDIRKQFTGKDATLSSAIKALRERNIIVSKEGARGIYRLQHKAFALWIKIYASVSAEGAQTA